MTAPDAGSKSADETRRPFRFSTTSWFFLDALDMRAPASAFAMVAFGDSITDGTDSTLNGDDRWPDVLARRLHAAHGNRVSVVNAGIGGNQVVGPTDYSLANPVSGGPSALARLERDVLSLSGMAAVIWLEGINDFSSRTAAAKTSQPASRRGGPHERRIPGVRVIGATVDTALGADADLRARRARRERRRSNKFIRTSGLFDAVVDFDAASTRPGKLQPRFVHDTTIGGEGDGLHPNRLGYMAMGMTIDLDALRPAANVGRPARGHRSALLARTDGQAACR